MIRTLSAIVVVVLTAGLLAVVGVGGAGAQEDVTLDITVVNQDGEGIEGAKLTVSWDGGNTTDVTLGGGGRRMVAPAGTDVAIEVTHEDYIRNRVFTYTTPSGTDTDDVEITVSRRGAVQATVQDTAGNPIEGAAVTLRDAQGEVTSVETDADGTVRTPDVERDEYELLVEKPGYLIHNRTIDISALRPAEVELQQGIVDVTFNVTDDHFDPPRALEDAQIRVGADVITTRASGERTTNLLVNQEYNVTITKEGYSGLERTLSVGEEDLRVEESIQRLPELNLEVESDRRLVGNTVGVVVTDEYGDGIGEVAVRLDGSQVTTTDQNGEAAVEITSEGEQEITVALDGRSSSATVEGVEAGDDDDAGDGETDDDGASDDGGGTGEDGASDGDGGTGEDGGTDDGGESGESADSGEMDGSEDPGTDDSDDGASDDDEDADDSGPGFGVLVTAVALLGAALLARRRPHD
jgi:PGF-CTERM protein